MLKIAREDAIRPKLKTPDESVFLDDHLTWKLHINFLKFKLNYYLHVLFNLKEFVPSHVLCEISFLILHYKLGYIICVGEGKRVLIYQTS